MPLSRDDADERLEFLVFVEEGHSQDIGAATIALSTIRCVDVVP